VVIGPLVEKAGEFIDPFGHVPTAPIPARKVPMKSIEAIRKYVDTVVMFRVDVEKVVDEAWGELDFIVLVKDMSKLAWMNLRCPGISCTSRNMGSGCAASGRD